MNGVVVFLILLGTFPFFFPDACRAWLERVQRWLVMYEERRKRQWRAECALEEETHEWGQWIQHAKRMLPKAKSAEERLLLLTQIRAAGERFLAGVARWEEEQAAQPRLKQVEEKTNGMLDLLRGAVHRPSDQVR